LASTLKEAEGGHPIGLILTSRFSLPEDPVRNLDFEAHGRKMAAEAWVVTVAMLMAVAVAVAVEERCENVVVLFCAWLSLISYVLLSFRSHLWFACSIGVSPLIWAIF